MKPSPQLVALVREQLALPANEASIAMKVRRLDSAVRRFQRASPQARARRRKWITERWDYAAAMGNIARLRRLEKAYEDGELCDAPADIVDSGSPQMEGSFDP